jgi:transcriptional regulator with XRE-family HTH domain
MLQPVTVRLRELRADLLLARNIRALLNRRGVEDSALAAWCGHRPAWLSKILSGERGIQVKDLGKVADFFGLDIHQLFFYGIDPLLERRKAERRSGKDRRDGEHRRSTDRERALLNRVK